ncbi:hypothetical protein LEN26_017060 [Aphanomyces euteiches]|nr:hypothetical protein LEN26_017060 [Aphanomyces euteiches]KAH9193508.1 hypothetical protein AeNC1_004510 [Aphanomyces euteiches]
MKRGVALLPLLLVGILAQGSNVTSPSPTIQSTAPAETTVPTTTTASPPPPTAEPTTESPKTTAPTPPSTTAPPPTTPPPPTTTSPPPTTTAPPPTTPPPTTEVPKTTTAPTTTASTTTAPTTTTKPATTLDRTPTVTTVSPTTASAPTTTTPTTTVADLTTEAPTTDPIVPVSRPPVASLAESTTPKTVSAEDSSKSSSTPMIIGVTVAAVLAIGIAALFVFRRRQREKHDADSIVMSHRGHFALEMNRHYSAEKILLYKPPPAREHTQLTSSSYEHDSVLPSVEQPNRLTEPRKRSPTLAAEIAVLGSNEDRSSSFFTWDSHRGDLPREHPAALPKRTQSAAISESSSFSSQKLSLSYSDHLNTLNLMTNDDEDEPKYSFLSYGSQESRDVVFTPVRLSQQQITLPSFDGGASTSSYVSTASDSRPSSSDDIYRTGSKEGLHPPSSSQLYSFDESILSDEELGSYGTPSQPMRYSTGSSDSGYNL